jgi:hypothetical protein
MKQTLTKDQSDIVKALIYIVFKNKSMEEQSHITTESQIFNNLCEEKEDLYAHVCYYWLNKIDDTDLQLIPNNIESEILALRIKKTVSDVELKTESFENKKSKSNRVVTNKNSNNILDNTDIKSNTKETTEFNFPED